MNKSELVEYLEANPSWLRENHHKHVAKKFNLDHEFVKEVFKELKEKPEYKSPNRRNKGDSRLLETLEKHNLPLDQVKRLVVYGPKDDPMYSITPTEEWLKGGEKFKEVVESLLEKMKEEIKPITLIQKTATTRSLFIYTSDKHIGAKTESDALFDNEYNAKIFKERLLTCIHIAKEAYDHFGRFDKIYIIDLGDALDGYNQKSTRQSVLLPQNLSNEEQINTYFEAHKELFDNLVSLNITNNIEWLSCSNDNHGGSWAYAAHKVLDVYLECKYPEIKRTIITKFMDHITYGCHTFIFTHGKDKKDMKHGLPLILSKEAELFINSYIHYYKIHTPNIHLIKGDLHQSSRQDAKLFRYKNCRSLYGSSSWIMNNFGINFGGIDYEIVDKHSNSIFENKVIFN